MASLLTRRLRGDPDPDEFDPEAVSDANQQAVDDYGQAPGADREPRGRTSPAPPPRAPDPVPANPVAQAKPRGPEQDPQAAPIQNIRPAPMQRATNDQVSNRPPAQADPVPTPYGAAPFAPRSTPAPGPYDLGLSGPMSPALGDYGAALKQAQDRASKLRLLAGLARGADTINRALTRQAPAPSESAAMLENEGEAGIKDVLQRQALGRQQNEDLLKLATAAHGARLRDPTSPESQAARKAFLASETGGKFATQLGPGFENLSASQLPGIGQLLTNDVKGAKTEQLAKEADPTSDESARARETFMLAAKVYPGLAEKLGDSISKASALEIHQKFYPLLGQQAAQIFRAHEDDLTRKDKAARAQSAAARASAKDAKAQATAADKEAALTVPGFDRDPSVKPSSSEVAKLRETVSAHQAAMDDLNDLRGLHKQFGAQPLPTDAAARYRFLSNDLQLQLKGIEGLPRINETELQMFSNMVPDPSRPSFALNDRTPAILDQLEKRVHGGLSAHAKSLGYTPKGSNSGGTVKVKKGSEVLQIPRADLQAAQAEGYALVQ